MRDKVIHAYKSLGGCKKRYAKA
ncbi:hypothetical protein [Archaeoglobus neptunius]